MRVHWTNAARCHLQAIYDYIAQDSKRYARRMVDRLTRRSQQLSDRPLIGAKAEKYVEQDIREVFVKKKVPKEATVSPAGRDFSRGSCSWRVFAGLAVGGFLLGV